MPIDLKLALREKGLSQAAAASKLDVSRVTVNNWVRRRFKPAAEHIPPLAMLLGLDPKALAKDTFQSPSAA